MHAIQRQSAIIPPVVVPVAIYTRVSTLHQVGGRFDSCESQAAICRDFIRKHAHEGWHEVACFTDAAYSGGSMNRPGIQALKRQIAAGEIKIVVIFKLERVLRSTDEWGPFRAFLNQHGCRLVSTTEDLSEETPSGRLKNNLLVSVAEYERLNTAEKVRAKLAELAKRGIWNCGLVPYGFRYDATAKALHPHPIEAEIVRRIYADAARLVSLTELANALNEEGRRTRDAAGR
jgi:DNA invertase Pin-like site-specific DNA recombinase